jgi:hypothetical protein
MNTRVGAVRCSNLALAGSPRQTLHFGVWNLMPSIWYLSPCPGCSHRTKSDFCLHSEKLYRHIVERHFSIRAVSHLPYSTVRIWAFRNTANLYRFVQPSEWYVQIFRGILLGTSEKLVSLCCPIHHPLKFLKMEAFLKIFNINDQQESYSHPPAD